MYPISQQNNIKHTAKRNDPKYMPACAKIFPKSHE
jgi:hypothetical protein